MSAFDEDDLQADVARLKAKWFGPGVALPRALDAEEEAMAAKWLGRSEARKLAETRAGRIYRPPVVLAHYGFIPAMRESYRDFSSGAFSQGNYWYVECFRGSEKSTVFQGDREGCLQAVSRLQRMNISVTRVGHERSPEELTPVTRSKPARSKRYDADWLRRATSCG